MREDNLLKTKKGKEKNISISLAFEFSFSWRMRGASKLKHSFIHFAPFQVLNVFYFLLSGFLLYS